MSWDRVHDTHLMHKVPLQVFEQHNPCYTSLLIFSASLQASLTLLHLVVSLCITTSALHHHSLKAKSACLQLTFQLSHEIYFLQWFQVSLLRSFCLLLWRDLLKTKQLFSFLCLFWFDQLWRWGFLWMGWKKKSIDLLYRGFCLVSMIKYLMHEKIQNPKSPKLMNIFIERIQLSLPKKCVENARTDVVHTALLQAPERCLLHCSLHSHDEMLHSLVQED